MITAQKRYLFVQISFSLLCFVLFILFIVNSNEVTYSIGEGIDLCTHTIIPSLFPFFIISELLISGNIINWIGTIFKKPCNIILGISGISIFPILMGMLCGFPVGAKIVITFFEKGYISKKEAERILCYCNNPSPAFLINVVGSVLYSNVNIGVVLLCTTLMTSIIIGICCNLLFGKTYGASQCICLKHQTRIPEITNVIEECVSPILKTCAYIIFFSALMGCIKNIMMHVEINDTVQAIVYGIIELSGGTKAISLLNRNMFSACLLAFIIGWSGLSVHLQIKSICQRNRLNLKPYIISKFVHGIANALAIGWLYIYVPHLFNEGLTNAYVPTSDILYISFYRNTVWVIFVVMAILFLRNKLHKNTFHIIY